MQFIRTKRFQKDLKRIGASASDLAALEQEIASQPDAGDVIRGMQGLRKIRFRIGKKGKSGGARAIYYAILSDDTTLMLTAYGKNEQADLTPDDRKAVLRILKELTDG